MADKINQSRLDYLITKYIKPDYHAVARLILVDYPKAYWWNRFSAEEEECTTIVYMVDDKPHTMEYVDWNRVYYNAPFTIVEVDYFNNVGAWCYSRGDISLKNPKAIRDYLKEHYPLINLNRVPLNKKVI